MSWWGKVIGGAFGFMFGGPLGALFGAALGHNGVTCPHIRVLPGEVFQYRVGENSAELSTSQSRTNMPEYSSN